MKVTKKAIRQHIKDIKALTAQMGWKLYMAGVYTKAGEVQFFTAYHGQGTVEDVYNRLYDRLIDYTSYIEEYLRKEATLDETVENIYDIVTS